MKSYAVIKVIQTAMQLLPEHLPVLHCSTKSKALCIHWGTQAYTFAVLWCKNSTCIYVLFYFESHPSLRWQCHKFNSYFFRPVRINITGCLAHSKFQDSPSKSETPLNTLACCLLLSMKSSTKLLKRIKPGHFPCETSEHLKVREQAVLQKSLH